MEMTGSSTSRPECGPNTDVSEIEEETEDEDDQISANYDVTYTFQPRENNDKRSETVERVKVGKRDEQASGVGSLHVVLPFDNDCDSTLLYSNVFGGVFVIGQTFWEGTQHMLFVNFSIET